MPTYQVKDWDKHFENNKSRTRDRCSFVCVPNKQDGMGLTRLLAEPDGAAIYGIWQLILGACSRQRRPRDGWLTADGHREGTAWTPDDLSLRWRRTPEEIQRALDVLSSEAVGWIKVHGECPASALEVPDQCPPGVPERKGREGKGTEDDGTTRAPDRQPFEPDPEPATTRSQTPPAAPPDEQPVTTTLTEVIKFTNSPAFDGVDRTALLRALTRGEVPPDRHQEILVVVEDSLKTRGAPPAGVKDSPTGYALEIIRRKAKDIKDARAAEEASKRDQGIQRVDASNFYNQEEMDEFVKKHNKRFPGIKVVFYGEPNPEEEPREPPPPSPAPPAPKAAPPAPPEKTAGSEPPGDGRPAPYHLLQEFPSLWSLDNRSELIGALVDLKPNERLTALRFAMKELLGTNHEDRAEVALRSITEGFREDEKKKTDEPNGEETEGSDSSRPLENAVDE